MNARQLTAGAWDLAERIKAQWRAGGTPDAAAAVDAHPELASNRSVVIDLAYEEYLLRECAGAPPDPARFAQAFPDFQASVQDLLEAHCLLMAQPELLEAPAAEWPAVGSIFEGLELRAELGRGAFGRAYLGYDPEIGRLRAIKLAPGGAAEAKLIGRLAHPNVIDVFWMRRVGRRTAVCMPFVGSATLADAIAANPDGRAATAATLLRATQVRVAEMQPDAPSQPIVFERDSFLVGACAIGARIADAVDYLHRNGVVHGDIKPTNVVLEPGGSPRVIDFNLAAGEEPIAAIRGTPAYMAPELLDATLSGRSAAAANGPKADLFALGVTIVEFLTGRHPFRAASNSTLASLAAAIHKGPPQLPRAIPAPIARVLRSCLAVRPEDRPGSASELTAALERFVGGERTRGARRKRQLLLLAALALVAVLASFAMAPVRVEATPDSAEAFQQRGIRLLHEGKPAAARADFLSAHEHSGNPTALAFAAYCYALGGEHEVAIERGRLALAGGAVTAEAENNLGHSLVQRGDYATALPFFDSALRRSPELLAARYNRALASYKLVLKGQVGREAQAIADIEQVLVAEPRSGAIHLDAARIFLHCAPNDGRYLDRALSELELAVATGLNPDSFQADPTLSSKLTNCRRFKEICQGSPSGANPVNPLSGLVEPLP